ncbi:M48 family metallopeptidase [Haloplanus aerogenes]|uniref:YgjP-like metallopeptidase domain-containing protein n=1 Tax=Haloplanus aerogenes TaxID=660522 RepID=A0A3M0DST2_9EURY|nr:YgjP-like metallopeptidase domain-containing protein [Haloplanus aerogenes]RMB25174.1 hypothetical protein ATH50_0258 [Haloplanus aerogenes]
MSDDAAGQSRYHVGVTAIPYTVDRESGRETIDLSLTGDAELVVRAPVDATTADVAAALDDRRAWLLDSLYGRADPDHVRAFTSGESLLYGGRRRPLRVAESPIDDPSLQFDGSRFVLRVPRDGDAGSADRRRAVVDWYRTRAAELLPDCARGVAGDRPVPSLTVDDVGRRWVRIHGDRLRLHWRLVLAPRPVAAYTVAHALVRRDHDPDEPAFWTAVDALAPNARASERWLRLNGARLHI